MISGVFPHESLKAKYGNYARINDKIAYEVSQGKLIRLRKGWYTTEENLRNQRLIKFNAANVMAGPSYVSLYSSLAYWGLIPERVHVIESCTIKRKNAFNTPIGRFVYRHLSLAVFSIGITRIEEDGVSCLIANAAKALCDIVWTTPGIRIRSLRDAESFICDDLRIDETDLAHLSLQTISQCLSRGPKKASIEAILKFVRHAD